VNETIQLLIATRNAHKVAEIQAILGGGFRCLTLNAFPGAPTVVEDAATFTGNAAKKAVELARWLGEVRSTECGVRIGYVLADDSGLEVDALGGKPGVHSARFAAMDSGQDGNSKDSDNNAKLLRLLGELPEQRFVARFRCVIALVACHSQSSILNPQIFSGTCEGRINLSARGSGGFGYDPLFVPDGYDQSFAELGEDVKNKLSHRAKALDLLKDYFATNTSA
jgi:XTP/dITP diphosphohydrolase